MKLRWDARALQDLRDIRSYIAVHGSPAAADCVFVLRAPIPLPKVSSFMILVAIFSVIVLLMCWLCYHGDCND